MNKGDIVERVPRDRNWSDFEVNRHYDQYFASIGAVQVSEGQGNRDLRDEVFTDYIRSQFGSRLSARR